MTPKTTPYHRGSKPMASRMGEMIGSWMNETSMKSRKKPRMKMSDDYGNTAMASISTRNSSFGNAEAWKATRAG